MQPRKGDYTTTWKIIHDLSGKDRKVKVKVKMRDGAPPKSDKDLLVEWQEYFSSLLNNDNGQTPPDMPQPAAQDLPIHDHPPTLEETLEPIRQMKTNMAAATWLCYYRRSSSGWRWCNGRCYPLLQCWSVLKSDTTWPVDHQPDQHHCPSAQWPTI